MRTCMCCSHAQTDHNLHGCMLDGCHCPSFERAGDASPGPTRPGYQHSPATYVEGREAPRRYLPWANAGGPNECAHGYAAGIPCPSCDATVEACARAAYEESLTAPKIGAHGQAIMDTEWSALGQRHRGYWIAIARAVLAAAKGAGR